MATITIPENLINEKDLMLIPRLKYEGLLKRLKIIENYEHLWKSSSKDKFSKSYGKSDEIYDQI